MKKEYQFTAEGAKYLNGLHLPTHIKPKVLEYAAALAATEFRILLTLGDLQASATYWKVDGGFKASNLGLTLDAAIEILEMDPH